jgi:hypothetical protein
MSMPGIPAIESWTRAEVTCDAARSAASFALWASNHIITAKTPRTTTARPSTTVTIARKAWASDSS